MAVVVEVIMEVVTMDTVVTMAAAEEGATAVVVGEGAVEAMEEVEVDFKQFMSNLFRHFDKTEIVKKIDLFTYAA